MGSAGSDLNEVGEFIEQVPRQFDELDLRMWGSRCNAQIWGKSGRRRYLGTTKVMATVKIKMLKFN